MSPRRITWGRQAGREDREESEPLIPGLPADVAELCLLHLPYPYHALVRSVSISWNRAITDPAFTLARKTMSFSLPYLFVLGSHKSTDRIQWQAMDPRSGRWFVLPPMPCPGPVFPAGFACASLPRVGKLFVLGGMRSDPSPAPLDTVSVYDTSSNQWSSLAPMLRPRSFFAAGSVGDGRKILAVGGTGDGGAGTDPMADAESYDVESDSWAPVASLPSGLEKYDSAVVGGNMYLTEGWVWPFYFTPRGSVYDSERDSWREMSGSMREGWTGLSVVLGGNLFVIPEHGDCPMKVYVPDLDTWRQVQGDRFPREGMQRPFAVSGAEWTVYVASSGLNVAVGRVRKVGESEFCVDWELVVAPKAFSDFSPCNCQVLYA